MTYRVTTANSQNAFSYSQILGFVNAFLNHLNSNVTVVITVLIIIRIFKAMSIQMPFQYYPNE